MVFVVTVHFVFSIDVCVDRFENLNPHLEVFTFFLLISASCLTHVFSLTLGNFSHRFFLDLTRSDLSLRVWQTRINFNAFRINQVFIRKLSLTHRVACYVLHLLQFNFFIRTFIIKHILPLFLFYHWVNFRLSDVILINSDVLISRLHVLGSQWRHLWRKYTLNFLEKLIFEKPICEILRRNISMRLQIDATSSISDSRVDSRLFATSCKLVSRRRVASIDTKMFRDALSCGRAWIVYLANSDRRSLIFDTQTCHWLHQVIHATAMPYLLNRRYDLTSVTEQKKLFFMMTQNCNC